MSAAPTAASNALPSSTSESSIRTEPPSTVPTWPSTLLFRTTTFAAWISSEQFTVLESMTVPAAVTRHDPVKFVSTVPRGTPVLSAPGKPVVLGGAAGPVRPAAPLALGDADGDAAPIPPAAEGPALSVRAPLVSAAGAPAAAAGLESFGPDLKNWTVMYPAALTAMTATTTMTMVDRDFQN